VDIRSAIHGARSTVMCHMRRLRRTDGRQHMLLLAAMTEFCTSARLDSARVQVYSRKLQQPMSHVSQSAVLDNCNFLLNDDPYRQKTQPKYSSTSTRVGMPNFIAICPGVSEEIANTHERLSYFIYIDRERRANNANVSLPSRSFSTVTNRRLRYC